MREECVCTSRARVEVGASSFRMRVVMLVAAVVVFANVWVDEERDAKSEVACVMYATIRCVFAYCFKYPCCANGILVQQIGVMGMRGRPRSIFSISWHAGFVGKRSS